MAQGLLTAVTAKGNAVRHRMARFGHDLRGGQRGPIRVVQAAHGFRMVEPGGQEMSAAAIREALIADPYPWLDRRLFRGDRPLIFDNIRGRFTHVDVQAIGRELTIDLETGACQLFRALVHALTKGLGLHPVLPWNTGRPGLRGIGLSDNRCYARVLRRRFGYANTFLHKRPFLDICADALPYSDLDFIVASEVFEHVPPPAATAFRNSSRMLKQGGILVLTVPYGDQVEHTVEHYPSLHRWALKRSAPGSGGSDYYIENINARGEREVFDQVRFHGGPGQTVEMRAFAKRHLLELAAEHGFAAEVMTEDLPLFGIWNRGDLNSLPMILRKL